MSCPCQAENGENNKKLFFSAIFKSFFEKIPASDSVRTNMVLQCWSDISPRILFTEEHGAVMRSDGRDSGAVFHILHPEAGGNREYAFRISPVEQRQQTAALFIGTQKTIRIFIGFNHLKHGKRPVFHDSVEGGCKRFQTLFHTIIRLFLTLLHLKK